MSKEAKWELFAGAAKLDALWQGVQTKLSTVSAGAADLAAL
jgi:hypothetical protein